MGTPTAVRYGLIASSASQGAIVAAHAFGTVSDCSERTEILSPTVTLWQYNNDGGYKKLTSKQFSGGVAPTVRRR